MRGRRIFPMAAAAFAGVIVALVLIRATAPRNDAQLVAVDARTGRALWRVHPGIGEVHTVSPLGGKLLVVGVVHERFCKDAEVAMVLDMGTGRRLVQEQLHTGGFVDRLYATDGAVQFTAKAVAPIVLEATDRRTHAVLWRADPRFPQAFALSAGGGVVAIAVGSEDIPTDLFVFDGRSGRELWSTKAFTASLAIGDGQIYLFGARPAALVAFDARTGRQRWARSDLAGVAYGDLSGIAAEDGVVVTGLSRVYGLTPTGSVRWSLSNPYVPIAAAGGTVFLVRRGHEAGSSVFCGGGD